MIRIGGWRARLLASLACAGVLAASLGSVPSPLPAGLSAAATSAPQDSPAGAPQDTSVGLPGASPALPAAVFPPDAIADLATGSGGTGARLAPPDRSVPETARIAPASSRGFFVVRSALSASDGLDVTTATTYAIDAKARVVRVGVDVVAVNRLPVTPGARYYFPGVNLAIQPEATQVVASEGGTRDRATTTAKSGYRLLAVQFASQLYVGQTARLHVAYLLPAGAPRSASDVRVGAAFASFMAWAFGDRGTVEVDVPAQYGVDVSGGSLAQATGSGGVHVLTGATSDPGTWYAWIDARNDSALTSRQLQLPGGEQVVVHAWPEDPTWERSVAQTLTTGIPALEKRIGLPWPVQGELSVVEVSSSLLEGYAGFYSPSNQKITISEELDPLTIVHETSHAWFNSSLFGDRWITEGLADEYAYRTLTGLGKKVSGPGKVRTSDAAAFALDTWGPPQAIKTKTQDVHEQWGYDASWTVVRKVVAAVGEAGMATVFAAASAGTSAYAGPGGAEKTQQPADWRRFVDLAEEVGGAKGIAEMIAPWVLVPAERTALGPRAAARTAYHSLVAAGGGWSAPIVVRKDLDTWDFSAATSAIADARSVLALRDAMRGSASSMQLALPTVLQAEYQGATTPAALVQASADERALGAALDAVVAANTAVSAPRDWIEGLGLVGQDPSANLTAARAAWTSGDASSALAKALSVSAAIAVAADAGRLRLVAIGVGALALLVLVLIAVAVVRRRVRRRGTPQGGTGSSGPGEQVPQPAPEGLLAPADGWIDPTLAPPPPPGWRSQSRASGAPADTGPYPILPASVRAGTRSVSAAGRSDEGAQ